MQTKIIHVRQSGQVWFDSKTAQDVVVQSGSGLNQIVRGRKVQLGLLKDAPCSFGLVGHIWPMWREQKQTDGGFSVRHLTGSVTAFSCIYRNDS